MSHNIIFYIVVN